MAKILDLESLDNFINEIYDDMIRIKKMETVRQNESGENVLTFWTAYTYAHLDKDVIVRFLDDCGDARMGNADEIKKVAEQRNHKMKESIEKLKEAGKTFGLGMWTI